WNSRYQEIYPLDRPVNEKGAKTFADTLSAGPHADLIEQVEQVYRTGEPATIADRAIPVAGGGNDGEPRYFTFVLARYEGEVGQTEGGPVIGEASTAAL